MNSKLKIILALSILFAFSSCGINSSLMFKTNEEDVITEDIPLSPTDAFRLSPNDKISILLFTENGKKIIDLGASIGNSGNMRMNTSGNIEYLIRKDGTANLPVLGMVDIQDLTIIEAQEKLRELYATYYVNPFIQIQVTNRRVIVFPGAGGDAAVVQLKNENTTLMEVLALAGGIAERGKAKNVKLIRKTEDGRVIYQIDLSKAEGLQYADLIVQSNDYIYVEPTKQITREFLKEIAPIASLISIATLIITTVISLQ